MLYECSDCFTISLLIMKRGLALLSLLLVFNASAQIEVSSKKQETVFCTNMGLHCINKVTVDTVTTYWVSFRDAAYKHIEVYKSLEFSNKELLTLTRVHPKEEFQKEILEFVSTKKMLTYFECKYLFKYDAIENNPLYYNDNILGKFYRKDFL